MLIELGGKKWIQITTLIASSLGAHSSFSLARRLHVMSVEDEVHEEEVTTQKLECMKSSLQSRSFIQLSLLALDYNESQANLRDDDDVHFQRWLRATARQRPQFLR